ncbi:MAG: hypothetical protein ABFD92_03485 [Planctomycetaceae bacterium]|nr:hypothetical protein [Planctomycetaceae bacterium]
MAMKNFGLYLLRWQLSTPLLAGFVYFLTQRLGATLTMFVANLFGAALFFWIDRWIFVGRGLEAQDELWEVRPNVTCAECLKPVDRGYRLLRMRGRGQTGVPSGQFRCLDCSHRGGADAAARACSDVLPECPK